MGHIMVYDICDYAASRPDTPETHDFMPATVINTPSVSQIAIQINYTIQPAHVTFAPLSLEMFTQLDHASEKPDDFDHFSDNEENDEDPTDTDDTSAAGYNVDRLHTTEAGASDVDNISVQCYHALLRRRKDMAPIRVFIPRLGKVPQVMTGLFSATNGNGRDFAGDVHMANGVHVSGTGSVPKLGFI